MDIICLFAQRKQRYPGQYAPELLAAIDQYGDLENPEYMIGEIEKAKNDNDIEFFRRLVITVPDSEFDSEFYGKNLNGKVSSG